ncbi:hypothetical protein [Legionella maioricensis]|uniref:Uncharacterized protein n=1 Tax=Legionella maioricensis TaxID=2896528 RepID=A0A9X2D0W3_9GAMM|nr:hypothetical protein [Legionella maioricensis]MCL9684550.1 hypothetical protein [Legionella maioricensis]MCL9687856.1 hypothetical protein [Legionella maioricensis]
MNIEFQDLREQLLQFKHADSAGRVTILDKTALAIKNLPQQIQNKERAGDAYTKMSYAATLINYADALQRIENQDYFNILIDFKMVPLFEDPRFSVLNQYFEFHHTKPQMRLKKPINQIPTTIWQLFRVAQKAQLELKGTLNQYHLDELDILNPPPDQLYPLPIQMMGQYENESVDRVSATPSGKYRFATRFGEYLLPGGGMVEIDLEKTPENLLRKMLDEHLEEEHANLWIKANHYYDEINPDEFVTVITQSMAHHSKLDSILENPGIREQLEAVLVTRKNNSVIIAELMELINHLKLSSDLQKKSNQQHLIHGLKAAIQVEPFKRTALYDEAYQFIKSHSIRRRIEQFGDTRAVGGKQISNSFLMTGEPLDVWFSAKFPDYGCKFGDDLTGCGVESLTLLQALAQFRLVKYSHILIVLAHQLVGFKRNTLYFDEVWDIKEFQKARKTLLREAQAASKLIQTGL